MNLDESQMMESALRATRAQEMFRTVLLLTALMSTLVGLTRVAHAALATHDEWNIADAKFV